ncbi:MAG: aldehyde dehydrogenase family protein, partial [Sphingobium sp.]
PVVVPPPGAADAGNLIAPHAFEVPSIESVRSEIFGPVLHIARWSGDPQAVIDRINGLGFGLTLGIQTRIDSRALAMAARAHVGNVYVNRNIIGAVVGVQPFGGHGLSGTGPKAGGPLYLGRLVRVPPNPFAGSARVVDEALRDFAAWLSDRGEAVLAEALLKAGATSPSGLKVELPGPVGERNLYACRPRGRILLKATTARGFHAQLGAVLATGNEAVLDGMAPPDNLPPRVAARIAGRGAGPCAAILVEGGPEQVRAALQQAAAMPGPVVSVHAPIVGEGHYSLAALVHEVSTSINTAAAGGNASLMMIG